MGSSAAVDLTAGLHATIAQALAPLFIVRSRSRVPDYDEARRRNPLRGDEQYCIPGIDARNRDAVDRRLWVAYRERPLIVDDMGDLVPVAHASRGDVLDGADWPDDEDDEDFDEDGLDGELNAASGCDNWIWER